jgi:outer membrane receptor for ferrienterochelin and colicin
MKLWNTILLSLLLTIVISFGYSPKIFGQEAEKKAETDASKLAEMNLDDLLNVQVTTASKKAEKTTEAPGIMTTITSEEIKYLGANNLTDVLERVTSFQEVGSSLFPQNQSTVRGDLQSNYDNHVLILINGKPMVNGVLGGYNEPVYSGFPLEMIDRIEIIRGPGSVLYGSNAFVGVVNIITKDSDDKSSLLAKAGAGSFGTVNGLVMGKFVKDDFKAKISSKIENINGWDYSAMTVRPGFPNSLVNRNFGGKNFDLNADLSYKGLSFSTFYINGNQDMLGILPYTTYAGKNTYEEFFFNLGYNYKFSDTWDGLISLTHNGMDMKIDDQAAAVAPDHQANSDYTAELTINGEVVNNLNVVFGGVLNSRNKNSVAVGDAIANPYHQTIISGYLQADYKPVDVLKLIAGAQLNKLENQSADIVPRLGAIFNITDQFGLKALYSSAYRSPWPVEQLLVNPAVIGNPNLTPEKIGTLDIQLFYSGKGSEASLTYYNSHYTNSIIRQPLPNNPKVVTYINLSELHTNGFEFEGKVQTTNRIFITGSATIQNNADESTTKIFVPNFMGKIGAFYKMDFGFTVGIFNTFFGKPLSNTGKSLNPAANSVDLLSLNLNYKLPVAFPLEFNVYVKNLLNSAYNYPEYNRGWVNTLPLEPGRAIYGTVSVGI